MVVHVARTNIDLDEELVQRVMVRYHLSTKREAVDYALRHLAGEPLTRMQAAEMLGSTPDFAVPTESGPRTRSRALLLPNEFSCWVTLSSYRKSVRRRTPRA